MNVKMTEEDEPPSYEEATGLKKMLPQNIGRQLTRVMSQQDEEAGTTNDNNTAADQSPDKLCSKTCCIRMFLATALLGIGILLTIIGSHVDCSHSILPMFILVSGCSILGAYAFCILAICFMFFGPSRVHGVHPSCIPGFLVCLDSVFFVFWWIAGCCWTWISWGRAGCIEWVYWVALVIIVLPPIILTAIICKASNYCKACC